MDCASSYSTSRLLVAGRHHARGDAQPGVLEVVRLVDQQRVYWPPGTRPVSTARVHGVGQRLEVGVAGAARRGTSSW
jgi:hypothetical protein